MREYLVELAGAAPSPAAGRNIVREYLQALVLSAMQKSHAMTALAFHGGTALRFLYSLPRFSEDLDFALERPEAQFDFVRLLQRVRGELERNGFPVRIKAQTERVVKNAFIHFPGLLYDLGLSTHATESLAVKLEIDSRPPAGAILATTLVRRHVILHLQHHDPASLLAGKLNATLTRSYTKGRDWFDLLWYLGNPEWPVPNLPMLQNALDQSAGADQHYEAAAWRELVLERAEAADFKAVRRDLAPFLQDARNGEMVTLDSFRQLLGRKE